MENLHRNISLKEASCPCDCGTVASNELLDNAQTLRDRVGFPLPFSSIVRCPTYNKKIGGSSITVQLLSLEPGPYGALDIKIKPSSRKEGGRPDLVFRIVVIALQLGANNIEICDGHVHISWTPFGQPMFETVYWGMSK